MIVGLDSVRDIQSDAFEGLSAPNMQCLPNNVLQVSTYRQKLFNHRAASDHCDFYDVSENKYSNVSVAGDVNRTAIAFVIVCRQRAYVCTAFVIRSRTDQSHPRNGEYIGRSTKRRTFHESYGLVDGDVNRLFTVNDINNIITL